MAKPRIISQKKSPRVVREDDYSLVLKWQEPKKEDKAPLPQDEAAKNLRKEALKDITPVEGIEDMTRIEKKGGILHKVRKKIFG